MTGRASLDAVVEIMRGFPARWCIAGGWAIDLFLGKVTRPHEDVDIAVFREDQLVIHDHFAGWTIRKVVDRSLVDWSFDEWLSLPIHEVHIESPGPQPSTTLEILLNEQELDEWVFRRHPDIRRPIEETIEGVKDGLPILSPAIVLLYKAKDPRPHDLCDFESVRQGLDPDDRQWLKDALEQVYPGHEWLLGL